MARSRSLLQTDDEPETVLIGNGLRVVMRSMH